jgi:hypothetical protein
MKMRTSNFIIISIAQRVMGKYGFGCRFHDLEYFEVGNIFIFLEFIINLKLALNVFFKKTNLI